MSDGPANFRREVAALDDMLAQLGGEGWDGLAGKFFPAPVAQSFDPGERVKRFLAAIVRTPDGREFIQWLSDLTWRAPYPSIGASFEQAAIAAKAHESRAAVGEVVLKAVTEGNVLLNHRSHP